MSKHLANFFLPALFLIFGLRETTLAQTQTNLPTLTQVEQIRRLSLIEAKKHYPVKMTGVVLDYSSLPALFISDGTNGIYVRSTTNHIFAQGQLLEIEGKSDAGGYAPVIVPSKLQIIGEGKLPVPQDVSFQKIVSGVEDSQWIRVSGIVRSTTMRILNGKMGGRLICPELTLATEDGGRLPVLIDDYHGESLQPLVDAEVVVTGIAEAIYNGKRQLINVRLLAPEAKFVKIIRTAPEEIATAPIHPIDSLRQFSPEKPSAHRVKIQGAVTLQEIGKYIFISDGTGSIRIETTQTNTVLPGDHVEVFGFPAVYNYTPVMEDAIVRRLSAGSPAQPVKQITVQEAEQRDHDDDLISVNARLLYQSRTPDQLTLVLQKDDILFRACLIQPRPAVVNIRNGAQLQVTGICEAQFENNHSPRAFQMILRSPADIMVLSQPSWWTPARLRLTLCILAVFLLGTGIWVWTLRRRVSLQTQAIREKIQREAVLQERMRIARELHDNLEQELAGVRMQLELTAATVTTAPQAAIANLQMARTMVSHSQAEARRSVWELRSQILEDRTLPAALSATASVMENGSPIEVKVLGEGRTLPMRVESNLLRIAQEAITNAIKHSKARHISVQLAYEAKVTHLRIQDDGCGFCLDKAPDGQTGHFGLLGMRERIDKIAGTLNITTAPGKGTIVEVFVPQTQNHANGS